MKQVRSLRMANRAEYKSSNSCHKDKLQPNVQKQRKKYRLFVKMLLFFCYLITLIFAVLCSPWISNSSSKDSMAII